MDTTEVIDQQSSGEATVKENAAGSATETVASDGSQGQEANAGGEQSSSEGGKEQGTGVRRPKFVSKQELLYEYKQKLRERDSQIQQIGDRLDQFEQMFKSRDQKQKPSRTFWEAPEEVLDERITGHLSEMEKRMYERMEQRDTQNQQTSEWKQETSEAAKLITSQKGITDDDIQEIQEIVQSTPVMKNLRPTERAEYALYLWNREKGITDKSGLKAKAASIQGAPGAMGGKRVWTESDMKRELDKFPVDPSKYTPEQEQAWKNLDSEFRNAYAENRVRK